MVEVVADRPVEGVGLDGEQIRSPGRFGQHRGPLCVPG
jgi:hypothetical protein